MVTLDPVRSLLDRIRMAGGSVTTNGRSLRVRELAGRLPPALAGELQLRQREVYRYLMGLDQEKDGPCPTHSRGALGVSRSANSIDDTHTLRRR